MATLAARSHGLSRLLGVSSRADVTHATAPRRGLGAVVGWRLRAADLLEDGLLLILLVYALPVVILAVGLPFALLLWLVREIAARL
jgi:hypothetical protein